MLDDAVVVFDGVCNLCSGIVQFILEHDSKAVFRFATFQSQAGSGLLTQYGIEPSRLETIVLVKGGRAYTRSDAALELAREFGGVWRALALFRIVPQPIRDGVYSIIANNRYRWFGRKAACMVPSEDMKSRFLE